MISPQNSCLNPYVCRSVSNSWWFNSQFFTVKHHKWHTFFCSVVQCSWSTHVFLHYSNQWDPYMFPGMIPISSHFTSFVSPLNLMFHSSNNFISVFPGLEFPVSYWCVLHRVAGWVAGWVAGIIIHSWPVDHSRKFPAFSTRKLYSHGTLNVDLRFIKLPWIVLTKLPN